MIENHDDFMDKAIKLKAEVRKNLLDNFHCQRWDQNPAIAGMDKTELVSLMLSRITKYPYVWGQSFPLFENLVEG